MAFPFFPQYPIICFSCETGATYLIIPLSTGISAPVRSNSLNRSHLTAGKQTHMKCGAMWLEVLLETENTEVKLTRVFVNPDPTDTLL